MTPTPLQYRARGAQVDSALDRLEGELQKEAAPLAGRPFASYDGCLTYLSDRYGLSLVAQIPSPSVSNASPPSAHAYLERARAILMQMPQQGPGRPPLATDGMERTDDGGTRVMAEAAGAAEMRQEVRQLARDQGIPLVALPTFGIAGESPTYEGILRGVVHALSRSVPPT